MLDHKETADRLVVPRERKNGLAFDHAGGLDGQRTGRRMDDETEEAAILEKHMERTQMIERAVSDGRGKVEGGETIQPPLGRGVLEGLPAS